MGQKQHASSGTLPAVLLLWWNFCFSLPTPHCRFLPRTSERSGRILRRSRTLAALQSSTSRSVRCRSTAKGLHERVRRVMWCFYSAPQHQSRATERKIKEEFEKLGRWLKTEEANMLAALKREETQKIRLIQMIAETSRDTFSLSDRVKNIEELVTDGSFLTVTWKLKEGSVYRN